jgi:hypothetical protein
LNLDETLKDLAIDKMKQVIYTTSFLDLIKRELEEQGQNISVRNVGGVVVFDFHRSESSIDKGFSLVINHREEKYDETLFTMHLMYRDSNPLHLSRIELKCKFGETPQKLSNFGFFETIPDEANPVPLARLIEECIDSVIENWDFEMIEG